VQMHQMIMAVLVAQEHHHPLLDHL